MARNLSTEKGSNRALPKVPSGIAGLDDITGGGLPKGRPTLVCGGAGSGKTLFATEFLACGASELGDPGVFLTLEGTATELAVNAQSLGFDLDALVDQKKLVVDYLHVDRSEIEETGETDVMGMTSMPCSLIKKGYSFVEWLVPRYFTTATASPRHFAKMPQPRTPISSQ